MIVLLDSPSKYGSQVRDEPLWGVETNSAHSVFWLQTKLERKRREEGGWFRRI